MFCKKCGREVNEGEMFCHNCGEPTNPGGTRQMPESEKKSNSSLMVLGVCLTLIAITIIIVLGMIIINDDEETIPDTSPIPTEVVVTTPPQTMPPPATPVPPTPTPQVIIVTETPTPVEETIVSVMYVVKCNNYITLRKSPSTSAAEITKIPLGASVGYISSASNGFYKVSYNGQRGYALAAYLSASPEVSAPKYTTTYLEVVNCDSWISLRSTPSTSASRIKKIPLGAYVEYIEGASNGFYKVRYNGSVGYALAQYLR